MLGFAGSSLSFWQLDWGGNGWFGWKRHVPSLQLDTMVPAQLPASSEMRGDGPVGDR